VAVQLTRLVRRLNGLFERNQPEEAVAQETEWKLESCQVVERVKEVELECEFPADFIYWDPG
jgi:hypothetical protein